MNFSTLVQLAQTRADPCPALLFKIDMSSPNSTAALTASSKTLSLQRLEASDSKTRRP